MENTLTQNTLKPFNVTETVLKGRNLIEASAGTGKTFSLAVMAVRLIVEQGMLPKEILMVTFTDMATAELQERVRKFIREAYRYAENGIKPKTEILMEVVDNQPQQAKANLAQAIQQLDELNISTIHGFCQRTLNEFAFETEEAFGKELVKDLSSIYTTNAIKWLRTNIYTKNLNQISELVSKFNDVVLPSTYIKLFDDLTNFNFSSFEEFIERYRSLENKNIHFIENETIYRLIYDLYEKQYKNEIEKVNNAVLQKNVLTFSHFINNLHQSLNNSITNIFAHRFKVLFIDEFQDTDKKQFEIFQYLFKIQTTFFIGDPKQAIYGFRGGDIFNYFNSKKLVDHIYTLNTNYRSAPQIVNAVNKIFDCSTQNSFYFNENEKFIEYFPSKSLDKNKIEFKYNKQIIEERCYIEAQYNISSIADHIHSLLKYGEIDHQQIKPNQIAFLAKKNEQIIELKRELERRNIPAVIINDEKIFQTEEKNFIQLILDAFITRNTKTILKILDHPIFNIQSKELNQLDITPLVHQFYNYHLIATTDGVYDALKLCLDELKIESYARRNLDSAQKFWANCNQIAEQLETIKIQYNYSVEQLYSKLVNNELSTEDTFTTRIESDENAVQLLTMHSSKGLEFDFVFTSDLNFLYHFSTSVKGFYKYYDPNHKKYFIDPSLKNIGYYNTTYKNQYVQENRRLLYVALTRAKHGLFCYYKPTKKDVEKRFVSLNIKEFIPFPFLPVEGKYQVATPQVLNPIETEIKVSDKGFRKMSFSGLSGHDARYEPAIEEVNHEEESYNQFALQHLAKGTTTGNLIHQIFEFIDFTKEDQWHKVITNAIKKYAPKQQEQYTLYLPQLIKEVLYATITIGDQRIQLKNIGNHQKVNELEFDIRSNQLNLKALEEIERDDLKFALKNTTDYYGMLNGLIDLVFEHHGKYYILDWKTNFLGNQVEHYNQKNMLSAMEINNYHLQYTIYTYALNKYLESRIPTYDYETHFGGVAYLFIRGIRKDQNTGIFTNRITLSELEQIKKALA